MLGGCRNDNINRSACMCCSKYSLYICWYTWVCSTRVRTAVMGLDPPQSTRTSIIKIILIMMALLTCAVELLW